MKEVDWAISGETLDYLLKGQMLRLFSDRAIFWKKASTLVVADIHLGKSDTFRSYGIAMPVGTTNTTLQRLSNLLLRTSAQRLLILGDLLHAKAGRSKSLLKQVSLWRRDHAQLAIDLVLGNHDRLAGQPPLDWGLECHDILLEPPFVWQHEPGKSSRGYVMAGHVHPAVSLRGPGDRATLPCFAFGAEYGLLPAFGDFTGYVTIPTREGDTVFVVADDRLIRFDA